MKNIGIYSGIFDPIHHGHISFAQKALKELGLDKVYFLVEPKPRRKTRQSDIRHRLNMAWLALNQERDLELLPLEHATFSVAETLPWLEDKFKDAKLHMLMGTDRFMDVHNWPGYEQLKSKVNFVVGQRAEQDSSNIPIEHDQIKTSLSDLASTNIRGLDRAQLATAVPADVARYISVNQLYPQ